LDELLERCTLRVWSQQRKKVGTGFFVSPGRVVTCAHVLSERSASGQAVEVEWGTERFTAKLIKLFPDPCPETDIFPDIAVLEFPGTTHPIVYLDEEFAKGDLVSSWGYSDLRPGGESIFGSCEGHANYDRQKPETHLIKLKETQIRPGISGAPLLNERTGMICGMIKRTRDPESDVGGLAIRGEVLLQCLGNDVGNVAMRREWATEWLNIMDQSDPDCFSEHSPQTTAIRNATASDCNTINFLNGEGRMDQDHYRKLTIRGRSPDDQTEIAQAIDNLISDTLRERVGRLPSGSSFKRRSEESDLGESWPIVSLDDRIKAKCTTDLKSQLRALLLTDEPGGGKSTTARNVAWRVAVRQSPFEHEPRQPVYIRLRSWEISNQPPRSLASYLEQYHSEDRHDWPRKAFWEKALGDGTTNGGKLFLVLDGLDELNTGRRFALDLLDECRKWALQGNVILVTCRTRSLGAYKSKLADFDILRINGLNLDETQQFVRKYPALPNPDRLVADLRRESGMLQLVRDPFLLDVICYLAAKHEGELPECRGELIEKAIEHLLLEVDLSQFNWPDSNPPSDAHLRRILAGASLVLRLEEAQGQIYNLFSFERFESSVQTVLQHGSVVQQQGMATSLTRFYCRTRFLQFPGERELSREGIGSFSHSLFLDFLAAEGLKLAIEPHTKNEAMWEIPVDYFPQKKSPEDLVAAKVFDPAWFELLSFLPSRLRKQEKFFEIVCKGSDDLSRHRATLAIRALAELSSSTLAEPDVKRWTEPVAQSCWDIATLHWRLGVTRLAEGLVGEISGVARIHPDLVERLADELQSSRLQSRLDALEGLDRIGTAAAQSSSVVSGLLLNLQNRNWAVRKLASATLAKMGPSAVKGTVERLKDPSEWYEKASACEAIGRMGATALVEQGIQVVELLLQLLSHKQALVRANACEALGNLGPTVPSMEQVIHKVTEHANESEIDSTVRAKACTALGKHAAVTASVLTALDSLVASVADDDWVVRSSASTALSSLARVATIDHLHLVQGLKRYLDSGAEVKAEARASVCRTFGMLQPVFSSNRDTITRLLVVHLADESLDVCKCASEAIFSLGIKIADQGIFARLLSFLEDGDWQVRTCAVAALGYLRHSLGDDEEHVLAYLFRNLHDSRWFVRASSCEVIGQLAPSLVNVRSRIIENLTEVLHPSEPTRFDTEGYVSVKALRALGKAGLSRAQSSGTIHLMSTFLVSKNWREQISACEAIGDIGPESAGVDGVMGGLIECLKSQVWCVRANACKTLSRLIDASFAGEEGIAELVACVCDAQEPVRIEAAEIITRLAGPGKLGLRFVLDFQQKRVSALRNEKTVIDMVFPRPAPTLFMANLPSPSIFQQQTTSQHV